jgi:hypothetical protein
MQPHKNEKLKPWSTQVSAETSGASLGVPGVTYKDHPDDLETAKFGFDLGAR